MFITHSKVGLLALALGAASISNGFSLPGNEDNSEQSNAPRISPQGIFAFINGTPFQGNSQMSGEALMNASYDYLQRKIMTSQNDTDKSNNILGLAALLHNHPTRNFPEMDSISSGRHVMTLLKWIIEGGAHDKNNHYARIHYGGLLLRRIQNAMTEDEKLFAGKVLSKIDKRYTHVGTLYYVQLILDHSFIPEGIFNSQIGQHCEDLLKGTYSHKHPRTGVESTAITRLSLIAQTRVQQSQSSSSVQQTTPTQPLPEIDAQPKILTGSEMKELRKQLERKATALKAQEEALLREQGVISNSNITPPSIPMREQEGSTEQVGQKRTSSDDIEDLFADSVLDNRWADNAALFESSTSEGEDDEIRRINPEHPDSDPSDASDSNLAGANHISSSTDTEMRDDTSPQDTPMRDEDASSSSSSSDDDSSSNSQRHYIAHYTDDQVQKVVNNIGASKTFQNTVEDRLKIWDVLTPEQKAYFYNDPNHKKFKEHVRAVLSKKLAKHGIELKPLFYYFNQIYTDDQLQRVCGNIGNEPFRNDATGREIIWREMTPEQKARFDNDPNSIKFSLHVNRIWSKQLIDNSIEPKAVLNLLREPYKANQIKKVADAFGASNTFQNNAEDRLKIWRELTEGQREHFGNDPNGKPFTRHVPKVWSKKLAEYGIKFISQRSSNNNNH